MDIVKATEKAEKETGKKFSIIVTNNGKFDGHIRIYPTMACNLRCEYCVNEYVWGKLHGYPVQPAERWLAAIKREDRHVVLTGGEPFLYPEIVELINGVDEALKVRVYSNFCLELKDKLAAITRPVHFYISWHPQKRSDRDLFLANVKSMQENPLFTADIHSISASEIEEELDRDIAYFADHGITVDKDEDQRPFEGSYQTTTTTAVCCKTIYLVGPDGTRYQCVSRLVRNDNPMENMLDGPLEAPEAISICPDFGNCAPCDILGDTTMVMPK